MPCRHAEDNYRLANEHQRIASHLSELQAQMLRKQLADLRKFHEVRKSSSDMVARVVLHQTHQFMLNDCSRSLITYKLQASALLSRGTNGPDTQDDCCLCSACAGLHAAIQDLTVLLFTLALCR